MKNINDIESNNKEKLKYFAEKAKEVITLNNNFHKQKEIYEKYIKEIKTILFDKDNIKENLKKINNQLKSNIESLKKEYDKIKSLKYNSLYKECTDELEMDKPLLNQLKSDKFTLEYTLSQKNDFIKVLTLNMKNSLIFTLFRQPKRDSFLDLKEGNSVIKEIITQTQSNILSNSKNFNYFKEKYKKDQRKKEILKNKIKQLKECIYFLNKEKAKFIQNFGKPSVNNSKHLKQSQIITNSNLKTFDRTYSSYETTPIIKTSDNKENIDNNKFKLSKSTKKYEEDIKYNILYNSNNDKNKIRKDEITNAIMSTVIQNSSKFNKYESINNYKNCETLKNDIEFTSSKNSDENKINNILNNKALSEENRKSKKGKHKINIKEDKIIQTFQNLEELFQITDSENEGEEIIIDNVIHSDDDTILEKKIIPKKNLCNTYIEKIESTIPKLNLDLIEFNKLKIYREVDLYSLERRNYKNLTVEDHIEITKKKIRKLKKKVKINSTKENAMNKFIEDLKNKYILYKKIKTKSSAFNSKVNYIANNEILDLNNIEEEMDSNNDVGSDYLNENDEITE